jgi:hypothetical protein
MRLTSARSLPLRASRSPACVLAVAMLGCGPTVSLDEPDAATGSSGTSTGAGPFGLLTEDDGAPTQGSLDDGVGLDSGGNEKLDVAPDLPLPPGSCAPDCQLELELVWAYDGFADGVPLDPRDHVAVVVKQDDAVIVAEQRQGEILLARLSPFGQEQWTLPLWLPCAPCQLVSLQLLYSGDLLLAGHGVDDLGTPASFAARVDLDGPDVVWTTSTPLATGAGIVPRAGSAVVLDDFMFQPVLEASRDGGEQLGVLAYDLIGGESFDSGSLATGLATGDAPPPLATWDTNGMMVIAHPTSTGAASPSGTVRWLSTPGLGKVALDDRVAPAVGLAAAPNGSTLALGVAPETRQSLLYLDSGASWDPSLWQIIHVLPTVTASRPALAVDEHGHAHVLARTAQGSPGRERDVALEVLRWSEEGMLIWKLTLPVALDQVDEPVSLELRPSGALVIGGFVAGARHVEERQRVCTCG